MLVSVICPSAATAPTAYDYELIASDHGGDVISYLEEVVALAQDFWTANSWGNFTVDAAITPILEVDYDQSACATTTTSWTGTAAATTATPRPSTSWRPTRPSRGYDRESYDFNVVVAPYCQANGAAGTGYVSQEGAFLNLGATNYDPSFVHETGHNFGANHASYVSNDADDAADDLSNHFTVEGKAVFDWLLTKYVETVEPHDDAGSPLCSPCAHPIQATDAGFLEPGYPVALMVGTATEDFHLFVEFRWSSFSYTSGMTGKYGNTLVVDGHPDTVSLYDVLLGDGENIMLDVGDEAASRPCPRTLKSPATIWRSPSTPATPRPTLSMAPTTAVPSQSPTREDDVCGKAKYCCAFMDIDGYQRFEKIRELSGEAPAAAERALLRQRPGLLPPLHLRGGQYYMTTTEPCFTSGSLVDIDYFARRRRRGLRALNQPSPAPTFTAAPHECVADSASWYKDGSPGKDCDWIAGDLSATPRRTRGPHGRARPSTRRDHDVLATHVFAEADVSDCKSDKATVGGVELTAKVFETIWGVPKGDAGLSANRVATFLADYGKDDLVAAYGLAESAFVAVEACDYDAAAAACAAAGGGDDDESDSASLELPVWALVVVLLTIAGMLVLPLSGHTRWSHRLLGIMVLGILTTNFDVAFAMETYDGGLFWASFVFMAVRVVGSGYYAATYALADKPVHDDIAKLRHPVGKGALLLASATHTSDVSRFLLDRGGIDYDDMPSRYPDNVCCYGMAILKLIGVGVGDGDVVPVAAVGLAFNVAFMIDRYYRIKHPVALTAGDRKALSARPDNISFIDHGAIEVYADGEDDDVEAAHRFPELTEPKEQCGDDPYAPRMVTSSPKSLKAKVAGLFSPGKPKVYTDGESRVEAKDTDEEAPMVAAGVEHGARREVTFHGAPLDFALVLARESSGRDVVRLGDVSAPCECFAQLQVLDELTHVDGVALPGDAAAAFREASARLGDAVATFSFPVALSFARPPAAHSVDFEGDAPLGLQFRLTAADGRSAVVVHRARGDSPAAALVPHDDRLVAVHGRPLPAEVTADDFDELMATLKRAPRPLRLTFWRSSVGGAGAPGGDVLDAFGGFARDDEDARPDYRVQGVTIVDGTPERPREPPETDGTPRLDAFVDRSLEDELRAAGAAVDGDEPASPQKLEDAFGADPAPPAAAFAAPPPVALAAAFAAPPEPVAAEPDAAAPVDADAPEPPALVMMGGDDDDDDDDAAFAAAPPDDDADGDAALAAAPGPKRKTFGTAVFPFVASEEWHAATMAAGERRARRAFASDDLEAPRATTTSSRPSRSTAGTPQPERDADEAPGRPGATRSTGRSPRRCAPRASSALDGARRAEDAGPSRRRTRPGRPRPSRSATPSRPWARPSASRPSTLRRSRPGRRRRRRSQRRRARRRPASDPPEAEATVDAPAAGAIPAVAAAPPSDPPPEPEPEPAAAIPAVAAKRAGDPAEPEPGSPPQRSRRRRRAAERPAAGAGTGARRRDPGLCSRAAAPGARAGAPPPLFRRRAGAPADRALPPEPVSPAPPSVPPPPEEPEPVSPAPPTVPPPAPEPEPAAAEPEPAPPASRRPSPPS
ncbi:hypothetical protein SO694_00032251 [Aureococcus anophagefferens]|uniref:PDZ domain-containing protein n=1 Tax=Aureococcus anophagefferens TaxID=44056 RepID=A0ABR1FKF2_AURAN